MECYARLANRYNRAGSLRLADYFLRHQIAPRAWHKWQEKTDFQRRGDDMSKVKVFRFNSGLVTAVDIDAVTDTINKWIEDNGVELVNVSVTSG